MRTGRGRLVPTTLRTNYNPLEHQGKNPCYYTVVGQDSNALQTRPCPANTFQPMAKANQHPALRSSRTAVFKGMNWMRFRRSGSFMKVAISSLAGFPA